MEGKKGRIKSSKIMRATEFKQLDRELSCNPKKKSLEKVINFFLNFGRKLFGSIATLELR